MKNHLSVMGGEPMANAGWFEDDMNGEGSSDDDNDDDDPYHQGRRLRRSSFGDAEDHMLFQRSAILPSGLHQRRALPRNVQTAISSAHSAMMNPSETPTAKRKGTMANLANAPGLPFHAPGGHYNNTRKYPWIKYTLLVAVALYALLWIQTMMLSAHEGGDLPPMPPLHLQGQWDHPLPKQQEYRKLYEDARVVTVARAASRKTRTQPTLATTQPLPWYTVSSAYPRPFLNDHDSQPLSSSLSNPASRDQLCGFVAKNSSVSQAEHYPISSALSKDSRVFITGLLSPLGINLALRLKKECGVEVIGGVDLMYPNTVAHRLTLIQERLALLTAAIPKLHKPVKLPFMGILPRSKGEDSEDFGIWTDMQPTHIIHLASYTPDQYAVVPDNDLSPYVNATWFARQSAWWGLEQLLEGMRTLLVKPQFLYVTTNSPNVHWKATQAVEQVLVRTYEMAATSVKLPQLYGEWDIAGSIVHDMIENVVQGEASEPRSSTTLSLLHVDDAVDAVLGALQYQPAQPVAIDLTGAASPDISTHQLATFLASHHLDATGTSPAVNIDDATAVVTSSHPALAGWQPQVSLAKGLIRAMAWHLHRLSPYGAHQRTSTTKVVERTDDFLKRHGHSTCEANDWECHKSPDPYFPCLSECNTRDQCLPSVFDDIKDLIQNVTEGCQIVLYTQALGYNVKDLALESEYMDDEDLNPDDKLICSFAFIPRDSPLVKTVTSKVPNDQLAKWISPQKDRDMHDLKLEGLNGRLLYRGWILLWVKDSTKLLNPTDRSLLKLSPSKLFHHDVERALFMEENFSVSPNLADIFFLVDQLKRRSLPKRTVNKEVRVETSFGKHIVKRRKLRLPPEPHRRAAILFAPLRIPKDHQDSKMQRIRRGEKSLKVRDAVKLMRHEWELEGRETEAEDRQREFYEKIPSYLNQNDLRSSQEPWYQYSLRHWVRTRWVVHDVTLEESRLLRCDWYREHLLWGNELDQLSFAQVMAVRELKRRIAHMEPDDHFKSFIEQHPQLKDLTDSYEWHPMETDMNLLYRDPLQWNSFLPDHVAAEVEEEPTTADVDPKEPVPLFVRIISEHIMASARKLWAKEQKKKKKRKKK
jgi:uncharacterized protein (UPF0147 family)